MKPEASSGPTRLAVSREFEPNRLAEDCQTRAYEQVLPVLDQAALAAKGGKLSTEAPTREAHRQQEGVAA
jgi:hypothetical protein